MSAQLSLPLLETWSQPFELPPLTTTGSYIVRIHPPGCLAEKLVTLVEGETSLGRDPECDLELHDDFVSRHHATLKVDGADVWVVDEGSRNGTFVNETRVEERRLVAGDHLRVGNHIFKFLSADHPEAQYHEAVYEMMTVDGMTGVSNRRYFEDAFRREFARSQRYSRPLAVLLADLDHFKRVNDLYGHLIGDECLREFCDRVRSTIRTVDLFARMGGEEFVIVLCEAQARECRDIAERIRARIDAVPFGLARKLSIPLTTSIGIAFSDGGVLPDAETFLSSADARLYEAKQLGRNRVCWRTDVAI